MTRQRESRPRVGSGHARITLLPEDQISIRISKYDGELYRMVASHKYYAVEITHENLFCFSGVVGSQPRYKFSSGEIRLTCRGELRESLFKWYYLKDTLKYIDFPVKICDDHSAFGSGVVIQIEPTTEIELQDQDGQVVDLVEQPDKPHRLERMETKLNHLAEQVAHLVGQVEALTKAWTV